MLLNGGSKRGGRGAAQNRSSSRGQGSMAMGRGASSSSSKSQQDSFTPASPRAMKDATNTFHSIRRNSNHKKHRSKFPDTGSASQSESSNPYEQERNQNAAKRAQRGLSSTTPNGRGGRDRGGIQSSKQVRFADSVDEKPQESTPTSTQLPSSTISTSGPFRSSASTSSNPFLRPTTADMSPTVFKSLINPTPDTKAFGAPSTILPPSSLFGTSSQSTLQSVPSASFGAPSSSGSTGIFGAPSQTPSGKPVTSVFGTPSASLPGTSGTATASTNAFPASNPFAPTSNGASQPNPFTRTSNSKPSSSPATTPATAFGKPSATSFPSSKAPGFGTTQQTKNPFTSISSTVSTKGLVEPSGNIQQPPTSSPSSAVTNGQGITLAEKVDRALRGKRLGKPEWPLKNTENWAQGDFDSYRERYNKYRENVRNALVKAGLMDAAETKRSLADALEFKGICEEMCPEGEIVMRISEILPDKFERADSGSTRAAPHKMVKIMARSSAGQESPLPMDVRSTAALRRTTDYLLQTLLAEHPLVEAHHFIWDRTRAVRRDFVFFSSLTDTEMHDQLYCLENIARFHITSLHLMANEKDVKGFVQQQEYEQLKNTLKSLMDAYDDCQKRKIEAENEAEFRAYYILFHREHPDDLKWRDWKQSGETEIALKLIETMKNTREARGSPKKTRADVAPNMPHRFFSTVEGPEVSYTMACFAQLWFGQARESELRTILTSYRRQKDPTKDWTPTELNRYLRFDNEADVIRFCEERGLRFVNGNNGGKCLSFETDDLPRIGGQPWEVKPFSGTLVERKRGHHSLPEVIRTTVYEEDKFNNHLHVDKDEEDQDLFVKDDTATPFRTPDMTELNVPENTSQEGNASLLGPTELQSTSTGEPQPAPVEETQSKPTLLFDRVSTPQASGASLLFPKAAEASASGSSTPLGDNPPKETPSIFLPASFQASTSNQSSPFSFLNSSQTAFASSENPSFPNNHAVDPNPVDNPKPSFFPFATPSFVPSAPGNVSVPPIEVAKPQLLQSPQHPPFLGGLSSPALTGLAKTTPSSVSQTPSQLSFFPAPNPTSIPQPVEIVAQSPPTTSTVEKDDTPVTNPLFGVTLAPENQSERLSRVNDWYTLGEDGLIDHFISFQVEQILLETMRKYEEEQEAERAHEEREAARIKREEERFLGLARTYGHRWRKLARSLWVKRKGREARKARSEEQERIRVEKAAQSDNIIEELRASVWRKRRGSLESILDATGVLSGVHDSDTEIRAVVQQDYTEPPPKRQRARTSTNTSSQTSGSSRHRREKSDNSLRRSILSDPSYLSGQSRIHLMPHYTARDENRPQVSGTHTDYFRLKARGIKTLPNGTPVAYSAAHSLLRKRSLDEIQNRTTPQVPKFRSPARSVPSNFTTRLNGTRSSAEQDDEFQPRKHLAREHGETKSSPQKRGLDDDEELELFARAKRVREQLDEGADWYRSEAERRSIS